MINVYRTEREKIIFDTLSELLTETPYEALRIRLFQNKKLKKCQVMIIRNDDASINLSDCEFVNKKLCDIKKSDLIFLSEYDIEISSPGINQPLTRLKDYLNAKEKLVKIYTVTKINDKKRFLGYLHKIDDQSVEVKLLENNFIVNIDFKMISEANLEYGDVLQNKRKK